MIDFDAEGNLIRKLTSTASETDAAAAANDLLERLHHKKTEPTASELEQLAREAAGKVNRFYFDKTQKEVPYEIILSVCQRVQELTRMSAAKPTTGEWTAERIMSYFDAGQRMGSYTQRMQFVSDDINAALAADRDKMERLEWQLATKREQLQKAENEVDEQGAIIMKGMISVSQLREQLAAAQAAILQHNRQYASCVTINSDYSHLNAAIAAAVKKAEVLWRKGWHECDICRTQWFISVEGIIGCPVCQDKRVAAAVAEVEEHNIRGAIHPDVLARHVAAAQKPLVDALTKITKSVDALEGQAIEYSLGVQLAKDCIAAKAELANVKEGK